MTAILFDGFDLGDTEHRWTSAGASQLDTTPVRTGTHSRFLSSGGVGPYYAFAPSEDDTIYCGFGFYHDDTLINDPRITLFFSEGGNISGGHVGLFRLPWLRGWSVRRGVSASTGFSGTELISITPNVWFPQSWHYIEFGAKIHDTAGWVELRQDGVTIGRFDGDTRDGGSDALIDVATFVQFTNSGSFNIDDVYILNEQGTVNNTWLGDTRCFPLYPNGNGTSSTPLSGSDGNSTDNYLLVDEAGTPVTTDYVFSTVDGDQDTYTFQDLPVTLGTIRGVEVRAHAAKDDTGTKQIRMITRRSGTDDFGPDHVLAAIPLYQTHHDIHELDPHAGPGTWTITNVNDTEWGIEVRP